MAFATVRVLTLENILKDDLCIWQLQVNENTLPGSWTSSPVTVTFTKFSTMSEKVGRLHILEPVIWHNRKVEMLELNQLGSSRYSSLCRTQLNSIELMYIQLFSGGFICLNILFTQTLHVNYAICILHIIINIFDILKTLQKKVALLIYKVLLKLLTISTFLVNFRIGLIKSFFVFSNGC